MLPVVALCLLAVPVPLAYRLSAAVGGLLIGLIFSIAFMTETIEHRAAKAGYPAGHGRPRPGGAGRARARGAPLALPPGRRRQLRLRLSRPGTRAYRHLEVGDVAVDHLAADLLGLEPLDVPDRLRRLARSPSGSRRRRSSRCCRRSRSAGTRGHSRCLLLLRVEASTLARKSASQRGPRVRRRSDRPRAPTYVRSRGPEYVVRRIRHPAVPPKTSRRSAPIAEGAPDVRLPSPRHSPHRARLPHGRRRPRAAGRTRRRRRRRPGSATVRRYEGLLRSAARVVLRSDADVDEAVQRTWVLLLPQRRPDQRPALPAGLAVDDRPPRGAGDPARRSSARSRARTSPTTSPRTTATWRRR